MQEMISLLLQAISGVGLVVYCVVALLYQPLVSWILFPLALGGSMILISRYASRDTRSRYTPVLIMLAPLVFAIAMVIRLGGHVYLPAAFAFVGMLLLSMYYLGVVLGAEPASTPKAETRPTTVTEP